VVSYLVLSLPRLAAGTACSTGVSLISKDKTSVISFNIEGIHPYDIGTIIDKLGIAVRTGHHCAQPIMNFFNIPGTIRASFAFYNTKEEIDIFVEALKRAKLMLS
jgi:cysteine desulfurase/selenocysteine lyase